MNKKVLLMILDGWGIAPDPKVSAIDQANTPFMDSLYPRYPNATLDTSGLAVGLPEGQMGNSEVGHMNIGAGRVVYQMLVKINQDVKEKRIRQNEALVEAFEYAKAQGKAVHFIGLVSDGGVHSHIDHLIGLMEAAQIHGVTRAFVHAFTDGRDTDPKSGAAFLKTVQEAESRTGVRIASVCGRYYAMDRDKRWERVRLAYDLMVHAKGTPATDPVQALLDSYAQDVTDEFVKPVIITQDGKPLATISEGDVVLCFNFRTDRGREITEVLTQQAFPEHGMEPLSLYYLTMTMYDEKFKGVKILFDNQNLRNTLGEVLAKHGKKQIRIAETEKYPHVTFFFSGGEEKQFEGEKRLLCASPKVATYDLQPEMSAFDIRDAIIPELHSQEADFICLNFANADMVGHTGVFEAAVKACEAVDTCAKAVTEAALANGYTTIIIADHGNSDCMINPDGTPNTAHTTNPVPIILVDQDWQKPIRPGKLGDLAPTILTLIGVPIPAEMTGDILI